MMVTKEKARIFLVDDHPAVRHGLIRLLGDDAERHEVLPEAGVLGPQPEA